MYLLSGLLGKGLPNIAFQQSVKNFGSVQIRGWMCGIMQHMEWLNAFLGMLLCIPLMPLIILFDFNCVLGLIC